MTACTLIYPVGSLEQQSISTSKNKSPSDSSMTSSEIHGRVKRPMNAFMVWSTKRRKELSHLNPEMHNSELSKRLGIEWRALTPDEKLPYIADAQKIREKHRTQYPGYRYPTTKRRRQQEAMLSAEYSYAATRMARMGSQAAQMLPLQQHMGAAMARQTLPFPRPRPANQPLQQFPLRYNQHSITVFGTPSNQAAPLGCPSLQLIPPKPTADSYTKALTLRNRHIVHHLSSSAGSNSVSKPHVTTISGSSRLPATSSAHSVGLVVRPPVTSSVTQSSMASSVKRPLRSLISCHSTKKHKAGSSLPDLQSLETSSTNCAVNVIQHTKMCANSSVQVFPVQQKHPEADHPVQVIKSPTSLRDHTVSIMPVISAASAEKPDAVPEDSPVQILSIEHRGTSSVQGKSGASSVITPLPLTPIVNNIASPSVSVQSDVAAENSRQKGMEYAIHKALLLSSYRAMSLSHIAKTKLPGTLTPLAKDSQDFNAKCMMQDVTILTQDVIVPTLKEEILSTNGTTPTQDGTATESMDVATLLPEEAAMDVATPTHDMMTSTQDVATPIENSIISTQALTSGAVKELQDTAIPTQIPDVAISPLPMDTTTCSATHASTATGVSEVDKNLLLKASMASIAAITDPPFSSKPSSTGPPPLTSRPSTGPPPLTSKPSSKPSSAGPPPLTSKPSSASPPPLTSKTSSVGPPPLTSKPSSTDSPPLSLSGPPPLSSTGPPPLSSKFSSCPPVPPLIKVLPHSPVQATPTIAVPVTSHVCTLTSYTVTPAQSIFNGNSRSIWSGST